MVCGCLSLLSPRLDLLVSHTMARRRSPVAAVGRERRVAASGGAMPEIVPCSLLVSDWLVDERAMRGMKSRGVGFDVGGDDDQHESADCMPVTR